MHNRAYSTDIVTYFHLSWIESLAFQTESLEPYQESEDKSCALLQFAILAPSRNSGS